jgi:hypothetical protein
LKKTACTLFLLTLWCLGGPLFAADDFYEAFVNPSAEFRPFVRWWWNGNCVTEAEILKQLDVMKSAGIGGVEINAIAMPESVPVESLKTRQCLTWLSPEWNRMVRIAAQGARERGMLADLIVGSGWPFGGRFLPREHQTKRVILSKKELQGPIAFESSLSFLAAERKRGREEADVEPELVFLRLVPGDDPEFTVGEDLRSKVDPAGNIRFEVPPGRFVLYTGFLLTGFTNVKLGAAGSDGPVVDHFNAAAVRSYLQRISDALEPSLNGRLGSALRAMFIDSIELDHANWTSDFPAEFRKRRGYDIEPYLPFVLDLHGMGTPRPGGSAEPDRLAVSDVILRARYDFCKTLSELFHERFIKTFSTWSKDSGVLARMQAYGREAHPLDAGMLVDIPEGESWLWSEDERIVPSPTVANKYVSSAAHLAGKRLVSFEAMTNAVPVFREMPEDFKLCYDMSLMSGVIHPILHGFNYSPPEAGFPGWVRFGSYYSPQNPWWPYLRRWSDYAARLTTVLSRSEHQAGIAILGPRADEWARHGLLYQPFPEAAVPWYHYFLWHALQQHGCSTDFVSEAVLQKAVVASGRLHYAPQSYEVLILEEVESLEPETAAAVARFAKSGGKVVFLGRAPKRAPGLADSIAKSAAVARSIEAALENPAGQVGIFPAPVQLEVEGRSAVRLGLTEEQRGKLLEYAGRLIERFGIEPSVRIIPPHPSVSQIHHREGPREVFFFANQSRHEKVEFHARFKTGQKTPWKWDPETGARHPMRWQAPNLMQISLGPAESLLLVFEPADAISLPSLARQPERLDAACLTVDLVGTPWEIEFRPATGEKVFRRRSRALFDFSQSADKAVATFGGTAVYRTEFRELEQGCRILDLGQVHGVSEVVLNGEYLGVRWWGRHLYNIDGVLKPGRNQLEIRVTTTLGNYCKSLTDNPVAMRWAHWFPPIPAGLVGPVRLLE